MILVPAAVLAVLVLVWNLGKSRLRVVKGRFLRWTQEFCCIWRLR